jgi:hypothetical protein
MNKKTSGTLSGAAAGAGAGATVGSVVPGIGTAIGAVGGGILGALGGYFSAASEDELFRRALEEQQRAAYNNRIEAEIAAQALNDLADGLAPELLTTEQYQVLEQYYPQITKAIMEDRPEVLSGGTIGRDALVSALDQASSMAAQGDSSASMAQRELNYLKSAQLQEALMNKLQQQAYQQNQGNININMARQLAPQVQDTYSALALQNVANQDNLRMQALQNMGNLGNILNQSDMRVKEYNTNLLNEYNKRLAMTKWDYEKQKTDALNKANQYNIAARQAAADKNLARKDDYRALQTQLRKQAIDTRFTGATGMNTRLADTRTTDYYRKAGEPGFGKVFSDITDATNAYAGAVEREKGAKNEKQQASQPVTPQASQSVTPQALSNNYYKDIYYSNDDYGYTNEPRGLFRK